MKFTLPREALLKPLQQVVSMLSSRPLKPILHHVLLQISEGLLSLTGTDLDLELINQIPLSGDYFEGSITVPARKWLEICRGLPETASITMSVGNGRVTLQSGRSRFTLSSLPASHFPNIGTWQSQASFSLPQATIKRLIDSTQFSMAHQDVRYHLNGMLFETEQQQLRTAATDGHRLAIAFGELSQPLPSQSAIVPRKGVLELSRLLDGGELPVQLQLGRNHLRVILSQTVFTAKLLDGRFPNYRGVIPQQADKILEADCQTLKHALLRAAILSNEKGRGVRFSLSAGQLRLTANNPEQEEAEELLDVDYQQSPLEIGFNVNYLLDILNALKCQQVRFHLTDSLSGVIVEDCVCQKVMYVVMPMRL
ncbi:MAG: DNA polymerase III subunit beta [Candidatus Symbiodolus clandestinus]